ncbi:MAG: hypothetical protein K6L73_03060 [Cellvibrionaceae bacterium]
MRLFVLMFCISVNVFADSSLKGLEVHLSQQLESKNIKDNEELYLHLKRNKDYIGGAIFEIHDLAFTSILLDQANKAYKGGMYSLEEDELLEKLKEEEVYNYSKAAKYLHIKLSKYDGESEIELKKRLTSHLMHIGNDPKGFDKLKVKLANLGNYLGLSALMIDELLIKYVACHAIEKEYGKENCDTRDVFNNIDEKNKRKYADAAEYIYKKLN